MGAVGRAGACSCPGSETDAQRNLRTCGGVGGGLLTAVAPWIQGCQSQSVLSVLLLAWLDPLALPGPVVSSEETLTPSLAPLPETSLLV